MELIPEELRRLLAEISDLGRARALLAWDERTQMPPGGAESRAEQLATLARVRHERLASDELGRQLDRAAAAVADLPSDSDEASLVRVARRDWEKARRVPTELRAELTRAASVAEHAWADAKQRSDFASFRPHLEHNLELRRRYVECFEFGHPYDPLLDDFEPEATTAEVSVVLDHLREGLRPLVSRVAGRSDAVEDAFLHGGFPVDAQRELVRAVVEELPLERGTWRLDDTIHPFATAISTSDLRLTTRYDGDYLGASLWSVIHEAGHGIYESGIAPALRRTSLGRPASLGFHESQSRLWENWVGRGQPYLRHLRPRLESQFPAQLRGVDAEALYRGANRVQPSLIRMEADVVTYDLHIVLRFELELELIEGRLGVAELPEAWNARMHDYLGLAVPDDARGVLQDVHWAAGSFGYFPTYALGNVIAGQIWQAVGEAIPELDEQLERGEFEPLRDWLRERLYRHGAKFTPADLIARVVGGPLDPEPYLSQLRAKVDEIYRL